MLALSAATPLIEIGSADDAPATHWISSGWMSPEEVAYLNAQLPTAFEFSDGTFDTVIDGEPVKITEDGNAFMARKGYRMKPAPATL